MDAEKEQKDNYVNPKLEDKYRGLTMWLTFLSPGASSTHEC